ncbi:hypothetical protein B0H19DRAFT_1069375 [Mycena capillaripes]|nr:hypothetical protein B0H19DRAFT_1069375 [Mycena capillaripes]
MSVYTSRAQPRRKHAAQDMRRTSRRRPASSANLCTLLPRQRAAPSLGAALSCPCSTCWASHMEAHATRSPSAYCQRSAGPIRRRAAPHMSAPLPSLSQSSSIRPRLLLESLDTRPTLVQPYEMRTSIPIQDDAVALLLQLERTVHGSNGAGSRKGDVLKWVGIYWKLAETVEETYGAGKKHVPTET